ncbi:CE1759 family FMN reductase [Kitasatospora sp. NPDC096147]|uniref:CE1759 family FMN reductase n=1 Tax=Kitasatospora sp. NPDC096147 TaxID=3364093 RepID=UPI0037FABC5D
MSRLVVVSAGLSDPSSTRLLADRLTAATARRRPVESRVVELRELAVDVAKHLVSGFPSAALREVQEAVGGADALIAVTPVFTASYSGLFKSFFDVLDPTVLAGKPVLLGATGGSTRHSLALEHALRPMFVYLRAVVLPTAVYAASADWGAGVEGGTEELASRIDRAGAELAAALGASGSPSVSDGRNAGAPAEAELIPFAQQLAALGLE